MRAERRLPGKMARGRLLQVIGIAAVVFLWGCGAPIRVARVTPEDLTLLDKAGNFPDRVYRVEPGDKLQVKFTSWWLPWLRL